MSKFSLLGSLQYFLDPSHTRLGVKVRRGCFWRKADLDVSLAGKTAIVTGANSGIGRATACELACRGASVHMLCRSEKRGTTALDSIKRRAAALAEDGAAGQVQLHIVDLSEPDQIRSFASDFRRANTRLDILVNNAAVMPNELKHNSKGMEVALATNLVGFYGLTTELKDLLKASSDARVVNVVSAGMFTAKLNLPTIEKGLPRSSGAAASGEAAGTEAGAEAEAAPYSGIELYAQHHRARVMLTDVFASQWKDDGISVNSCHPGWVDTKGLREAKDMQGFVSVMGGMLRSEEEGADTVVWLAAAAKAREFTGEYFFDRKARKKHKALAGTKSPPSDAAKLAEICQSAFYA
mmetsp:Transcript_7300/g.18760  ORF Transcript_7300/g.18760 Transcript_7300/m.18760 type:complete len:352 (-) Transcript_7300:788-1843(-)